jgi:hypothetical protein
MTRVIGVAKYSEMFTSTLLTNLATTTRLFYCKICRYVFKYLKSLYKEVNGGLVEVNNVGLLALTCTLFWAYFRSK